MITALHSNSYLCSRGTRSPLCMLSPDSNLNSCHTLSICPDSRDSAHISPTQSAVSCHCRTGPTSPTGPTLTPPSPSHPPFGCAVFYRTMVYLTTSSTLVSPLIMARIPSSRMGSIPFSIARSRIFAMGALA